jgi:hypothetical protein
MLSDYHHKVWNHFPFERAFAIIGRPGDVILTPTPNGVGKVSVLYTLLDNPAGPHTTCKRREVSTQLYLFEYQSLYRSKSVTNLEMQYHAWPLFAKDPLRRR